MFLGIDPALVCVICPALSYLRTTWNRGPFCGWRCDCEGRGQRGRTDGRTSLNRLRPRRRCRRRRRIMDTRQSRALHFLSFLLLNCNYCSSSLPPQLTVSHSASPLRRRKTMGN